MYGDTAHKHLLEAGWSWDGVHYSKTTKISAIAEIKELRKPTIHHATAELNFQLRPVENPHDPIERIRKKKWVLALNGVVLAFYFHLNSARTGVLGDIRGQ